MDGSSQEWPTPNAALMNDGESPESFKARQEKWAGTYRNSMPLSVRAKAWPTPQNLAQAAATEEWRSPKSRDFKGTTQDPQKVERQLEDGHQLNLNEQVIYLEKKNATDNWQTPTGSDFRTGSEDAWDRWAQDGRTTGCRLRNQVQSKAWPTPRSMDSTCEESPETWAARKDRKAAEGINLQYPLQIAAREWPTPRAGNPGSRAPGTGGKVLSEEAKNWPTPAARDVKGENSAEHCLETGTGRKHMDQLPNFVAHGFQAEDSPSPQDPTKIGDGSQTSSTQQWRTPTACTPNSLRGSGQDATKREAQGHAVNLQDQAHTRGGCDKRKRLNPCFVEWLMGMPHPFWSLPSCFAPIGSEPSETQ